MSNMYIPDAAHVLQDGIVISRVVQSSTDAITFEDFIDQLFRHCGTWPGLKSVLVMDIASFRIFPSF